MSEAKRREDFGLLTRRKKFNVINYIDTFHVFQIKN